MRKRWFLAIVVGIMVLALLLPSCAAPAPEVITLKHSAWTKPPNGQPFAATVDWCLREVERRSNGRVQFEEYWLGTLIPTKSEVEAMGKGVADICTVFQPFVKSRLTLIDAAALPGFGTTLREQGPAMFEVVKMQAVKDQFDKNNLVFMWVQGGDPIDVITTVPVRTVDDLKGLKIRSAGDQAKVMKALGAVPVSLTSTECPEALERGTVDGICMSYMGMFVWMLQEFGDYHTEVQVNTNVFYTFMNKDSWLALPDDIKKIFEEVAEESAATYIRIYEENLGKIINETWPAAGVEIIKLSAADKAKIAEASIATWDGWAKKNNEAGLAGTEVLNKWKELRGVK